MDLFEASSQRNIEELKKLIQSGVDINAKDIEDGRTALYHAISPNPGSIECMNFLLDSGADVNTKDNTGFTPLHKAAVHCINIEGVNSLIHAGADINCQDVDGNTALHMAAYGGRDENIKALLEAYADSTLVNKYEQTPEDISGSEAVFRDHRIAQEKAILEKEGPQNLIGRQTPRISRGRM